MRLSTWTHLCLSFPRPPSCRGSSGLPLTCAPHRGLLRTQPTVAGESLACTRGTSPGHALLLPVEGGTHVHPSSCHPPSWTCSGYRGPQDLLPKWPQMASVGLVPGFHVYSPRPRHGREAAVCEGQGEDGQVSTHVHTCSLMMPGAARAEREGARRWHGCLHATTSTAELHGIWEF